jgi:hypothetical protein
MCLAALAESPTTGHECGDGVEEEVVEVEETAGRRGGGRGGDVGRGVTGGLVVGNENGAEARECR